MTFYGAVRFYFTISMDFSIMKGMRPFPLIMGAILAVGLFSSCASKKQTPSSEVPVLSLLGGFDLQDINPFGSYLIFAKPIHSALYSTLFRLDKNLKPFPHLLESYEKKGLDVIFTLREGLRFSDGTALRAEDVVWSIIQSIRNRWFRNMMYKWMVDGEKILHGEEKNQAGIEVLNERRFVIHFLYENHLFPYYLSTHGVPIVPEKQIREGKNIYSGPFELNRIEEREECTRVYIRKNPYYSISTVKSNELCFSFFKTREAFFQNIDRGECHLFFNFMDSMPVQNHSYRIVRNPILGGFYIYCNPSRGVLQNRDMRLFFMQAGDYESLIRKHHWSLYSPATHIIPYGLEEYFLFRRLNPIRHKPAPLNQNAVIHAIALSAGIREVFIPHVTEIMKKYNLYLEVEWLPGREHWRRVRTGDFEVAFMYYLMDVPLAYHFYDSLFTPGEELNPGYVVERAQRLLEEYKTTADPLSRLNILWKLETVAREEAFFIPVYNILAAVGHKKNLSFPYTNYLLQIPNEEIAIVERN